MIPALYASLFLNAPVGSADAKYTQQIKVWREQQEHDLTKERGWLSLVGLYWLKPGKNTVGSRATCGVLLPSGAPGTFGQILFHAGQSEFRASARASFKISGATNPIEVNRGKIKIQLQPDTTGTPTRLTVGSISFIEIKRGARMGIRVWDSKSKSLTRFEGCKWFPVDPDYRVVADFVAYVKPKSIPITNVLGDTAPVPTPGFVTFKLNGKSYRLEAQTESGGLFFNFHDRTSGSSTYPAGRFLDAPAPKDGKVILDFNQATNPPCAFTRFATCPLPPAANYLDVAISAGEKTHHPG